MTASEERWEEGCLMAEDKDSTGAMICLFLGISTVGKREGRRWTRTCYWPLDFVRTWAWYYWTAVRDTEDARSLKLVFSEPLN